MMTVACQHHAVAAEFGTETAVGVYFRDFVCSRPATLASGGDSRHCRGTAPALFVPYDA